LIDDTEYLAHGNQEYREGRIEGRHLHCGESRLAVESARVKRGVEEGKRLRGKGFRAESWRRAREAEKGASGGKPSKILAVCKNF
jgi:hypothetical protein